MTYSDFGYADAAPCHMQRRFLPVVERLLGPMPVGSRVLDIGCGNGALAGHFLARGMRVVGVDLSDSGIAVASSKHPGGRFEVLPADGHLLAALACDPFDYVVSTEVIEHLYNPRDYMRAAYEALRPGGRFVCTTPYHGYWKNLALALVGKWDSHADPLWDGGHIKLFSRRSLGRLFDEAGFRNIAFEGIGRLPYLWMSMGMRGDKPAL
jgi:2-polyprenyl-3-methyl-5-hydroxy-6-metoxy-1,4-benzoquinol methylase